jgi:hypothetical protein
MAAGVPMAGAMWVVGQGAPSARLRRLRPRQATLEVARRVGLAKRPCAFERSFAPPPDISASAAPRARCIRTRTRVPPGPTLLKGAPSSRACAASRLVDGRTTCAASRDWNAMYLVRICSGARLRREIARPFRREL